jgi:DNA-binding response OmpR family regulator
MPPIALPLPRPSAPTVLVVDDDEDWLHEVSFFLSDRGMVCTAVSDSAAAESFLRGNHWIAVILVDLNLTTDHGVSMIKRFKAEGLVHDSTQLLFITGHSSKVDILEALRCGALDFLEKPVAPDQLMVAVEYAVQRHAAMQFETQTMSLQGGRGTVSIGLEKNFSTIDLLQEFEAIREDIAHEITDPLSWLLYLEAYRAYLQGRFLSVRPTSLALRKPYNSCLRAISKLKSAGIVGVFYDSVDRRRSFFSLSELGAQKMQLAVRKVRSAISSSGP